MIKRLLASVREFKKPTILTLIFIIGESIIETLIPFITAELVDRIKDGAELQEEIGAAITGAGDFFAACQAALAYDAVRSVLGFGLLLIVMAFASLACGAIAARCCATASAGYAKNLRRDLYDRINNFSFENVDKFSSTSLVTRMTTDVQNVQMSYMMVIRTAIRSPLMLIFSVIMAFIMGGKLGLTFAVIIPVLGFGLWFVGRKALPAFRSVFRKYDKLNESIEENVRGMRVVKGFSREGYEKAKFGAAAENISADFTRAERIVAWNRPIMQFCLYFNMVFVLIVGSQMAIEGVSGVDVGQLSAMLTYGMQVLMSLMMLSMIYVILTISAESMKRIDEVLCEIPSLKNPEAPVMAVENGSIDFDNVNFKYSERAKRNSLSNVDLHITSGMTVGVIGGTGSGKTSLVQLIPRLYDATEGTVKVGGVDVRNYDLVTLRDSVAMVLQKNLLFSGTIKENLRWGNPTATDEEIIEACKLAQADEFVQSFPEKYDTYIEQGGTNVSGGQKQRLCIARALLKKPKILILDDSTSAVDTKTDAMIRAGFKTYIPETTKIIIAQRVASVEEADLILVMENGAVAAAGKHEELLSSCEIYREIYEQQTKGGEDNE